MAETHKVEHSSRAAVAEQTHSGQHKLGMVVVAEDPGTVFPLEGIQAWQ